MSFGAGGDTRRLIAFMDRVNWESRRKTDKLFRNMGRTSLWFGGRLPIIHVGFQKITVKIWRNISSRMRGK